MVSAKINIARDQYGNYTKIEDAVTGGLYYCLNCGERLIANKGNKNIHFYKHFNQKGSKKEIECELYSSSKAAHSEQLVEHRYVNKVRFIITDTFKLKMKLPHLEPCSMVKMDKENLYFSINVQGARLHSTNLVKEKKQNYLSITPELKYMLIIKNKTNADALGYVIEDNIYLFKEEVLLFKKVSGEYINIPYRKTNLSEEFYVLSRTELKVPAELTQINYKNSNAIHFYHFYLDELTDSLIEWFLKHTGYRIIPNRKWMDMVYPSIFQYSGESILIETNKALIKVTETTKNEKIFYLNKSGQIEYLRVDEKGIACLNLEYNHIYNLQLDHEISNEISLKRIKSVNPSSKYLPNCLIDSESYKIENQSFKQPFSIDSDIDFFVFLKNKYPYKSRSFENQLPEAIHFPHIGTIYKFKEIIKENLLNLELLLTSEQWKVAKNSEYMYVMRKVKKTQNKKRAIYLTQLIKNYNKLPKKLIKIIRGSY